MKRSAFGLQTIVVFVAFQFLLSETGGAQSVLTPSWTRVESGYTTDGIALGDVHSSEGNELVVLSEGSTWYGSPSTQGTGKAIVLTTDGGLLQEWSPASGRDTLGFPLIEQLDGGESEYFVGEFESIASGGAVYALRGNAADPSGAAWILTPRGYPGLWNMGASSGNVYPGGGKEIVSASWDGIIQVLERRTGSVLSTYDTFTQHGEIIYGHAAIANVDGTAGNEIVVVGGNLGQVMVLSPQTDGTMTLRYVSNPDPDGDYVFGSGPAIGDIDGDGIPEIVVTLTGPNPVIRAYDIVNNGLGPCKYEWTATGASNYYWSSPAIGDVDGDGDLEVVAMGNDGTVSVLGTEGVSPDPNLCVEGAYEASHNVGGGGTSWFTPVLSNVVGSDAPDIIAATYTTLEILDLSSGAVDVAYQAVEPDASFYPSAVVRRGANGGPGAHIYISGWVNGAIYEYSTAASDPTPSADWHTFMGDNQRRGLCTEGIGGDCPVCPGGACASVCEGAGCDFQCNDASCSCDLDCSGATDECKTKCEGGSDCFVDCSTTPDKCKSECLDTSTCEYDCQDANKCDLKCKDDATCDVVCDGAKECKTKCENDASCAIDCGEDADKCKLECKGNTDCVFECDGATKCEPKCKDEASCDFDCEDAIECKPKCEGSSSCTVNCAGAEDCHADCKDDATCTFDCSNSTECKPHCRQNSICEIDCTGSADCTDAKCENNAECLLDCTGSASCSFDRCDGGTMSCPGDIIACNTDCP